MVRRDWKRAAVLGACALTGACGSDGASRSGDADGGASGGAASAGHGADSSREGDGGVGETASSLDGVWVATADPDQLLRFAPGVSTASESIALDEEPSYVEIIDGVAFYLRAYGEVLYFHDLKSGETGEIAFSEETTTAGLVFADGSLWIGDEALDAVWRVNPATRQVVGGTVLDIYDSDQNDGLELGASDRDVYVASLFGSPDVARLGTSTGTVDARGTGGDGTTGIAFGAGAAWVTSRFDGTLRRLDETDLTLEQEIVLDADLSAQIRNVGVGAGAVWVVAGTGGNAQDIFGKEAKPGVFRVDPGTNQPVTHIPLDKPGGLRTTEDEVWIMTEAAAVQIDPAMNQIARTLMPAEGEVRDIIFARTGGGTGSTQGLAEIDVYTVVEPPPVLCEDLSYFFDEGTKPIYGTGTASVDIKGKTTMLGNGTCKTLRDRDGKVIQYMASFTDVLPEPDSHVSLRIEDGYAGDGTYTAQLTVDVPDFWDSGTASVAISQGGRHGVISLGGSSELVFDCGADADVSVATIAPTPAGRGEALVRTPEGTELRFVNVGCALDILSEDPEIVSPEELSSSYDHYFFKIETGEPAEAGEYEADLSFNYFGEGGGGKVTLSLMCGKPVTGSFTSDKYQGSFSCP